MGKVFAGLDVSDRTTSICVVDRHGEILAEASVPTTVKAITTALRGHVRSSMVIGMESGSRAIKLHKSLTRQKYTVVSMDAFHAHSLLKTKLNKTDANDARGLASLLAKGMYSTAHIKSDSAYAYRTVIGMREVMLRKALSLQRALSATADVVGPVHVPGKRGPKPYRTETQRAVDTSLRACAAGIAGLKEQYAIVDKLVQNIAREDPICCRLMTVPGVGPITALTFMAAIDDPRRFESSRSVAPYFGLTPRVFQSGMTSKSGGISHRGDGAARKALYASARSLLVKSRTDCSLRRWGLRLARTKGHKVAYVACARKLAVLMHHLWVTGQDFDPKR
jgi:transposase